MELAQFLERVAERAAPPDARHVALCMGSLGAGLASMAFRGAGGEGEPRQAYMEGRAAELEELRVGMVTALDEEIEPIEVMELGVAALRLVVVGAPAVPVEKRGELVAACVALRASVEAAEPLAHSVPASADEAGALATLASEARRLGAEVSA